MPIIPDTIVIPPLLPLPMGFPLHMHPAGVHLLIDVPPYPHGPSYPWLTTNTNQVVTWLDAVNTLQGDVLITWSADPEKTSYPSFAEILRNALNKAKPGTVLYWPSMAMGLIPPKHYTVVAEMIVAFASSPGHCAVVETSNTLFAREIADATGGTSHPAQFHFWSTGEWRKTC